METKKEIRLFKGTEITAFFQGDYVGFVNRNNQLISPMLVMALINEGHIVLKQEQPTDLNLELVAVGSSETKVYLRPKTYVYVPAPSDVDSNLR